jgi:hypothetical protein
MGKLHEVGLRLHDVCTEFDKELLRHSEVDREDSQTLRERQGKRPPLWSSGQSSWLHNGDVLCYL